MKAAVIHEFGAPDVFKYEDVARPQPNAGEVLVKVYAAGINPVDWKTRQAGGIMKANGIPLPYILGWDISGVIEEVGAGVTEFAVGQEVYGLVRFPAMGSAYAEYLTAPVSEITAKPTTIDHVHAAAVPLAALTAWQGLFEHAKLASGQRILVQGAAGGVGHFVVQIAKAHGAVVIGTASARNSDYLREIGVGEVIDYGAPRYEDVIDSVDVVFETVSAANAERVLKTLKPGGFLVSCAGLPSAEILAQYDVRAEGFLVRPEASQLAQIAKLIDAGKIKPNVDAVFPLAEAGKAQALGELGRTRGKIVLKVV
ncbi:MAG: NADP-dependent oxidoreductase [Chloroflexota bacterium]